jgi:hypothetical protein
MATATRLKLGTDAGAPATEGEDELAIPPVSFWRVTTSAQRWVSRIHKALNAEAPAAESNTCSQNVANADYDFIAGESFAVEAAARKAAYPQAWTEPYRKGER